jgi:hypothetical protein
MGTIPLVGRPYQGVNTFNRIRATVSQREILTGWTPMDFTLGEAAHQSAVLFFLERSRWSAPLPTPVVHAYLLGMLSRTRPVSSGFLEPCLFGNGHFVDAY